MLTKKGLTLLELLIVVIIVGILAALAIPRYLKSSESSTAAEAYTNLKAIRDAEWAYYTKSGGSWIYTDNFNALTIDNPNLVVNKKFGYELLGFGDSVLFRATRNSGFYQNNYIVMYANGDIDEQNWLR